jgi:hypothetical protein
LEQVEPPLGYRLADTIDLTTWEGAPRSPHLDRLLSEIARRVGRDPVPQFRGLQSYKQTWLSRRTVACEFRSERTIAQHESKRLPDETRENKRRAAENKRHAAEERQRQEADEERQRREAELKRLANEQEQKGEQEQQKGKQEQEKTDPQSTSGGHSTPKRTSAFFKQLLSIRQTCSQVH